MNNQRFVADQRGMPVEDVGGSSARISISGETVAFFYSSSGTRTADAGQAAATMVEAVLAFAPIANSSGDQVGNPMNTSLSFTSTAFTNEIRLNYKDLEELDELSFAARLTKVQSLVGNLKTAQAGGVTTAMANGDYVVDYRKGILWGLKASTQTSLTSTAYKTLQKAGAVASTPAGTSSIAIAEDTASTGGEIIAKNGAVRRDTAASSAGTDGDWATVNQDSTGHAYSREGFAAGAEDNTNNVLAIVRRALAVSTYAATGAQSNSFTTTNLKASAGNLYGFTVINTAGSDRYLQFHNTATTPAGGATAARKFLIPAGTMIVMGENDWGTPLTFDTGIAYANSTTAATYTAGTAGDLLLDVFYK